MNQLSEIIDRKKVIVCLGSGGVGKTTTSAAIALYAAVKGRRVLCITVDPAKRLRSALNLKGRCGEIEKVDIGQCAEGEKKPGELYAQLLDTRAELDRIVGRYVREPQVVEKITGSPFYQQVAAHLSGSEEYMAMERLHHLVREDNFDLIVMDTPPSRHALDFIDAPRRINDLFSSETFRLFVHASTSTARLGLNVLKWNRIVVGGVSRFLGRETFLEILDFMLNFHDMYDGFKERAAQVKEMLKSAETGFMIVSTPEGLSLNEAKFLYDTLSGEGFRIDCLVINKIFKPDFEPGDFGKLSLKFKESLRGDGQLRIFSDELLKRTARDSISAARNFLDIYEAQKRQVAEFTGKLRPDLPVCLVPIFESDIHNVEGLKSFYVKMFGGWETSGDI
ncbi:MAG: ArsA family ATPase [Deltaproteobacteria bacterium]|nr:ArsA family ATPase [Deltaproteobacteria bacterium]